MVMRLATHATPPKRRFVDKASRRASFDAVHRIADRFYPALRTLFVHAWEAMREAVDWQVIAQALGEGNLPAVLVHLEHAWATSTDRTLRDQLRDLTQQIVARSAEASQPALASVVRPAVAIAFDAASPQVLAYAREHSAQLIRDIGQETRQAIRALLVRNIEGGRSWTRLVPELRATIGVTVRQADALVTRRMRLLDHGINEARIDQLIAQKTRAYLALRARTIARHETMAAANAGALQQVHQLVAAGVMPPAQYTRFVVVAPDERTCAICRGIKAQNSKGVGVLEPFQTPNGPQMAPPFHVICRCTTVIRATRSPS